jgi:hypothetical protein
LAIYEELQDWKGGSNWVAGGEKKGLVGTGPKDSFVSLITSL